MRSDNKKPLISVILPVFNCEKYVSQAIESILNQSFSNFELLIADDGSKDKSKKIIDFYASKDSRIIISHNNTNQGKITTVNRLFKQCQGEYLTIHDADDYSHPERFEKQVEFLLNNPDYALCGANFFSSKGNGPMNTLSNMAINYKEIKRNYLSESQIHGPTMVIRKNIIYEIGGLYRNAELFRNKEDVEFVSRVVEKYKVSNLTEPLYYYRNLPNSLSKSGYSYLKFEGMKLIKFLSDERKQRGFDSLDKGGSKNLDAFLEELEKPYLKDRSLLNRKSAEHLMYFNFFPQAIKQSILGIIKQPFIFENYRTAQFCIRKYLLSSIGFQNG